MKKEGRGVVGAVSDDALSEEGWLEKVNILRQMLGQLLQPAMERRGSAEFMELREKSLPRQLLLSASDLAS